MARMTPGATFGELAMLGVTQVRSTTARAMTFVMVWALRRSVFFKTLLKFPSEEARFREIMNASRRDIVFWPCLPNVAQAITQALDMQAETHNLVAHACFATSPHD